MIARWFGVATPESVMRGVQGIVVFLRHRPGVCVVISDASQIVGDWIELLPWLRYDFLPVFLEIGIRALAFLPSEDLSAQHGVSVFSQAASALMPVQTFPTETEARAWLARFCPA